MAQNTNSQRCPLHDTPPSDRFGLVVLRVILTHDDWLRFRYAARGVPLDKGIVACANEDFLQLYEQHPNCAVQYGPRVAVAKHALLHLNPRRSSIRIATRTGTTLLML